MKNLLYTLYAAILAVIAFYTQEIVTFIMLGVILLALHNIHHVLREISHKLDQPKND